MWGIWTHCPLAHVNVYAAHLVGREKFSSVGDTKALNLKWNSRVFTVLCGAAQCLQGCIVSRHVNDSLGILQIRMPQNFPFRTTVFQILLWTTFIVFFFFVFFEWASLRFLSFYELTFRVTYISFFWFEMSYIFDNPSIKIFFSCCSKNNKCNNNIVGMISSNNISFPYLRPRQSLLKSSSAVTAFKIQISVTAHKNTEVFTVRLS